jgi:hypothetical protein
MGILSAELYIDDTFDWYSGKCGQSARRLKTDTF